MILMKCNKKKKVTKMEWMLRNKLDLKMMFLKNKEKMNLNKKFIIYKLEI